jgi:hypothetical protein
VGILDTEDSSRCTLILEHCILALGSSGCVYCPQKEQNKVNHLKLSQTALRLTLTPLKEPT